MRTQTKACRYADGAFQPRRRGIGHRLNHALRGAAHFARGALLAAFDAARVVAQMIRGDEYERENTRISTRRGRSDG